MDNLFFDPKRLKYLGVGAIVGRAVRIRKPEEVQIGDYTIIDDFTYISPALETGRFCHLAPNVTISGGGGRLTLGDFVGISAGCTIHVASSDYLNGSFELPSIPAEYRTGGTCEDIVLEDHVLIGANSALLPGVHLPEGFAAAAHSVLRKRSYQPWTLWVTGHAAVPRQSETVLSQARKLLLDQYGTVVKPVR